MKNQKSWILAIFSVFILTSLNLYYGVRDGAHMVLNGLFLVAWVLFLVQLVSVLFYNTSLFNLLGRSYFSISESSIVFKPSPLKAKQKVKIKEIEMVNVKLYEIQFFLISGKKRSFNLEYLPDESLISIKNEMKQFANRRADRST